MSYRQHETLVLMVAFGTVALMWAFLPLAVWWAERPAQRDGSQEGRTDES